jgi:hypothetical protein
MPQYADPSFLLDKLQQINPVAAERDALTLRDLMTKAQSGELDLEGKRQGINLWSDPEFLKQISAALGGGAPDVNVLSRYPQAAQGGFGALQTLAEKQAEIASKRAGADKSVAETQKEYLAQAGHMADSVLSLAGEDGIVPPDKYASVVRAAGAMGLLRLFPTPPPQPGTPEATEYLKAMRAMTPTDLAQAGYRQAQTTNIPKEQEVRERAQASTEATALGGEAYRDPDTNEWFAKIPNKDPRTGLRAPGFQLTPIKPGAAKTAADLAGIKEGDRVNLNFEGIRPEDLETVAAQMRRQRETTRGPTASPTAGVNLGTAGPSPAAPAVPSAAAPTMSVGPSGGVKTGPSLQEREQTKALAPVAATHLAELTTKASAAAQMQEIVKELRNKEAEGMYSGALEGTDYFRKIAGIAAAMGTLKPAEVEKLSNTTAWDAEAITLLAQSVKQFSSRPAAAELGYLAPSKPQVPQTAEAREQIYQSLYRAAARAVQEAQQADAHLKSGNNSFGNFVPKFEPVKMPPVQVSKLPTLTPKDKGAIGYGSDNSKQYWDGGRWVPAPPDAVVPPR